MLKERKCIRCGEEAVCFVGMADPDVARSPMCKLHSIAFKYEAILCYGGNMRYKDARKLAEIMAKEEMEKKENKDDQKGN